MSVHVSVYTPLVGCLAKTDGHAFEARVGRGQGAVLRHSEHSGPIESLGDDPQGKTDGLRVGKTLKGKNGV